MFYNLESRPEELEEDAVKRAVVMAKKSNVPMVICGPTSKEALGVITVERSRGQVRAQGPRIGVTKQ